MSGIPKRLQGVPIFSCGRAIRGVGFADGGGGLSFGVCGAGDRKKPAGYIPAGFRYRCLLRTVLEGGLFAGGSLFFSLSFHSLSASSSLLLHPSSPLFRRLSVSLSAPFRTLLLSPLLSLPPRRPNRIHRSRPAERSVSRPSSPPPSPEPFRPQGSEERCRITRRSAAAQAERPAEPQPRRPAVPYAEKPFRPALRRRCPQPF